MSLMRETSPGDTVGVTRLDRFARSTAIRSTCSTSSGKKASAVAGASVANQFVHDRVCTASRGRFLSKFIRQCRYMVLTGWALNRRRMFIHEPIECLRSTRRSSSAHCIAALDPDNYAPHIRARRPRTIE